MPGHGRTSWPHIMGEQSRAGALSRTRPTIARAEQRPLPGGGHQIRQVPGGHRGVQRWADLLDERGHAGLRPCLTGRKRRPRWLRLAGRWIARQQVRLAASVGPGSLRDLRSARTSFPQAAAVLLLMAGTAHSGPPGRGHRGRAPW